MTAPVSDETGSPDAYDIQLRWSNEVRAQRRSAVDSTLALQEQLGLRLERRRVTTEVLVVDRLERRHPDRAVRFAGGTYNFP